MRTKMTHNMKNIYKIFFVALVLLRTRTEIRARRIHAIETRERMA